MVYLKVVITLKVFARFQKASVQLHWLGTGITLHPEEDMTLQFTRLDVCAIYNHVIQPHLSNFLNLFICENSVCKDNYYGSVETGRMIQFIFSVFMQRAVKYSCGQFFIKKNKVVLKKISK
jgi:hypothetical protein